MNAFYILAHDEKKLRTTLNIVDEAMNDLILTHQSNCVFVFFTDPFLITFGFVEDDRFYADSYGSGLLLRGVILQFLGQYAEAHRAFDEVMKMSKKFQDRSLLPANACFEKGLTYLTTNDKQRAQEYFHKAL